MQGDDEEFRTNLIGDLRHDAEKYETRAAALDKDAAEMRRRAAGARAGIEYLRKLGKYAPR